MKRVPLLGTEIAFIPQSVDYLDPLMRVEKQVIGVRGTPKRQKEVFRRYQLSDEAANMYPFQLSGHQEGQAKHCKFFHGYLN